MEYRQLGNTDIKVSVICLGTMTWGQQNTKEEAFAQMDYATEQGVNFFDTAELYPIPPNANTYTTTETIIGEWLNHTQCRNKIVLATKIAGPGVKHIRGGSRYTRKHLDEALDASLSRLGTDYIDLYQLHWPERHTNFFGQLGYQAKAKEQYTPFEEVVEVLDGYVNAGKIRTYGISNETPWGMMQFLQQSPKYTRVVSIQNPYNLLNRSFEIGLAEMSHRERVGLLAYSPLGFGVLTGKYLNSKHPERARLTLFPNYTRYMGNAAEKATEAYVALAQQHGISPTQMALSFVNSRPFVTSNIIGATTLEQLKENIESVKIELSLDLLQAINEIHTQHPNPSP